MDETIHFPPILDDLVAKLVKTPRRLEDSGSTVGGGGGGRVRPIMAYTGRRRPKRVPFSGFRNMNGADSTS